MRHELLIKVAFSWQSIKGIVNSPLGKISMFLPFIPIIIDVMGVVLRAVPEAGFADALHAPISRLLNRNVLSLSLIYSGAVFILVGKISFLIFAPSEIKDFEGEKAFRRDIMIDKKMAMECDERAYASNLSRTLANAIQNMEHANLERKNSRLITTFILVIGVGLILAAPTVKFIEILLGLMFRIAS